MHIFHRAILFAIIVTLQPGCARAQSPSPPADQPLPSEILFPHAGLMGIFDPSVTYNPKTRRLWMSYSYVSPSRFWESDKHFGVGLRLAYSKDAGANWQDTGIVISPFVDRQVGPLPSVNPKLNLPANSHGTWQSETSSIIYDPYAPARQRWKIIWHQYLKANGQSYFVDYAWIAMKTAPTPEGLANAPAIKLFGGRHLQAISKKSGPPIFAPAGGKAKIALNADIHQSINGANTKELNNCVWAEPSLLADKQGIHMALNCQYLKRGKVDAYVVMFSCKRPCNMTRADNWIYKGRILTPTHARQIGFRNYSAADLSRKGSNYYLTVTPVRDTAESAYEGCRVYRFANFGKARLARRNKRLIEVLRYDGIHKVHNGACATHEKLRTGILHSQLRPDTPPRLFHLLQTHVPLP